MELGQRLKEARIEAKLTQEELAKKLGVSRQTISNWENSRSMPDIGSAVKLGSLYNMSLDRLLSGEEVIQQFEDLAAKRRSFCQMMLEIGIILQLLGGLLQGLELTWIGGAFLWSGFLLLNVSIIMHLKVFNHSPGEIFRGVLGLTVRWMLIILVLLIPLPEETDTIFELLITTLNLVALLLIWSAGVWTLHLKSTRLWLIIVLWVGTPLLLAAISLQNSGKMVNNNPFLKDYRVEEVLYPEDSSLGLYALVELGSNSMILSMDGVNSEYMGMFTYAEPTVEDTENGIWLMEHENGLYRLTLEADQSVLLSFYQTGELQWQWKLTPDHRKASISIRTLGHSSYRHAVWYPNGLGPLEDPSPYFKSIDIVESGDVTIQVFGMSGKPLTLIEEYHHNGGIDNYTYELLPNKRGHYEIELRAKYGGEKKQYAIYRIPYEDGEFRFVLTLEGF